MARNQYYSDILELVNELVKGSGVESISMNGDIIGYYVNRGDTYDETIIWDDRNGEFIISSWGDFLEESEQSYCEEYNQIKCGYCGDFHDLNPHDWRETVCVFNNRWMVDGSANPNYGKELEESKNESSN